MLARILLPATLGMVALVRSSGPGWSIASEQDQKVIPEGDVLRITALIKNPGRSQICIDHIDITVSDSLATFTLLNETPTFLLPPDTCTPVELVASNFRSLRMSRRCIYRASLVDNSGQHRILTKSFINLWPIDYFGDHKPPVVLADSLSHDSRSASPPRLLKPRCGADLAPIKQI